MNHSVKGPVEFSTLYREGFGGAVEGKGSDWPSGPKRNMRIRRLFRTLTFVVSSRNGGGNRNVFTLVLKYKKTQIDESELHSKLQFRTKRTPTLPRKTTTSTEVTHWCDVTGTGKVR